MHPIFRYVLGCSYWKFPAITLYVFNMVYYFVLIILFNFVTYFMNHRFCFNLMTVSVTQVQNIGLGCAETE